MTGAAIVADLLRADVLVTSAVPIASIKLGRLADDAAMPTLLVRTISVVDRQPLKRLGYVRRTDRVSATVRAASYRDQVEVIGLVRKQLPGQTGNLAGAERVSILTAGTGPDLNGPANSFEQAQYFAVSFDEPV